MPESEYTNTSDNHNLFPTHLTHLPSLHEYTQCVNEWTMVVLLRQLVLYLLQLSSQEVIEQLPNLEIASIYCIYPYPLSVRGELTNLVQATPCGKVKLITVVGISCRRIGGNTWNDSAVTSSSLGLGGIRFDDRNSFRSFHCVADRQHETQKQSVQRTDGTNAEAVSAEIFVMFERSRLL